MKPRKPVRGDVVRVEGFRLVAWRVLGVDGKLAHLTKLRFSQRVDLRDVPVDRLTISEGVLS